MLRKIAVAALTLIASSVSVEAQLNPEQQMDAQQQAINQRRADVANCTRMHSGQVSAGVPAATADPAYNKCLTQADDKYNEALSRIGLTGSTARCTRPDGCGVPPKGFNPPKDKPPSKTCPMGGCQ